MNHSLNGFIEVRIVIDDDGVFATHLGHDVFDSCLAVIGFGGGFVNTKTDWQRTSKGNQVDIGTSHQLGTNVFSYTGQRKLTTPSGIPAS